MSIQNGQNADANDFINASAGAADVGKVPKLNASGFLDYSFFKTRVVRVYKTTGSPYTWTKPASLAAVIYEVQGPGSGGGTASTGGAGTAAGGPGASGAFIRGFTTAAVLGSTETITVPAGGAIATDAAANASFGAIAIAGKGTKGGNVTTSTGGTPGTGGSASGSGVNGDLALSGETPRSILDSAKLAQPALGGKSFYQPYGKGGDGEVANSGGSIAGATAGGDAIVVLTELFVD